MLRNVCSGHVGGEDEEEKDGGDDNDDDVPRNLCLLAPVLKLSITTE